MNIVDFADNWSLANRPDGWRNFARDRHNHESSTAKNLPVMGERQIRKDQHGKTTACDAVVFGKTRPRLLLASGALLPCGPQVFPV